MKEIDWCLIVLSTIYFAMGIFILTIDPYSMYTIFIASAHSFTLSGVMFILGLFGFRLLKNGKEKDDSETES